jgi:hypothetical protein
MPLEDYWQQANPAKAGGLHRWEYQSPNASFGDSGAALRQGP